MGEVMTAEEMLRLARETASYVAVYGPGKRATEAVLSAMGRAVAAERERCAAVVEAECEWPGDVSTTLGRLAAAIRTGEIQT